MQLNRKLAKTKLFNKDKFHGVSNWIIRYIVITWCNCFCITFITFSKIIISVINKIFLVNSLSESFCERIYKNLFNKINCQYFLYDYKSNVLIKEFQLSCNSTTEFNGSFARCTTDPPSNKEGKYKLKNSLTQFV